MMTDVVWAALIVTAAILLLVAVISYDRRPVEPEPESFFPPDARHIINNSVAEWGAEVRERSVIPKDPDDLTEQLNPAFVLDTEYHHRWLDDIRRTEPML